MRRIVIATVLLLSLATPVSAQPDVPFFSDDELGELRLYLHPRDWRALRDTYLENTYYPADLHWNGQVARNVGIRSRGSGSRSTSKPGLRVDIDYYATDQEFLGLKSFILDNNITDASLVRERVAMRFYARMGLHAPRERHVVLYVNDEFAGVYAVVESIDKRFLARVFGGEPGAVENDGPLFEYKYQFPYHFSYLGRDLEPYAAMFEARTRERDAPVDLWGPFEELTRRIEEDGATGIGDRIAPFLDPVAFLRYLAAEMFLAEFDGILGHWGVNNFYVYRFEHSTRMVLLPWDKDQTFRVANQSIWWHVDEDALVRRLLEVPELRASYLDALADAVAIAEAPVVEEAEGDRDEPAAPRRWLRAEIERTAFQIRDAAKRDPFRWHAPGMFDDEVDRLLEFAGARGQFVACEIDRERQRDRTFECTAPDRLPIFAPGTEESPENPE